MLTFCDTLEAPVFEVKKYVPNEEWGFHGIPAYIDLDDDRGRIFGTIHLDIPQEELPETCYAVFLDPSNVIIVRSMHSSHGTPLKPNRILCTTDLSPYFRKAPSDNTIVWLKDGKVVQVTRETFQEIAESQQEPVSLVNEVNEVVRLGVGSFFKAQHLDNDFKESTHVPPPPKTDPKGWVRGKTKVNGEEVSIPFDPKDVASVAPDQSWGVITKEDARVPISIH